MEHMNGIQASGPVGMTTRACRQILGSAAFFAAFYLYLWRVVEPHLIFHGAGVITNFPSFYSTRPFLLAHLSHPGGPVEYLAAFSSQMFYYSSLGALVITLQAWALYFCVIFLLRASGLKRLSPIGYVPALLLLILYNRYTYYVPMTMALLAALAFACVYVAFARRTDVWLSLVAFLVLSAISYYVAGGALLLFAAVCVFYELLSIRRWILALLYAAVGAVLPYIVGVLAFDTDTANAYTRLLPFSWELLGYPGRSRSVQLVYAIYLLVPATIAAGGILQILWARFAGQEETPQTRRPRQEHGRSSTLFSWYANSPRFRWLMQTTILLAVGAATAFGSLDHAQKAQFAIDYFAYYKMWPEVIAAGAAHLSEPSVMHAVNRALYHTGRLGNEMFIWPQRPEYLFLTDTEGKKAFWDTVDTYLEIGFINGAEHALTECLEGLGARPMVLQRLALANMIKGNIGTARVYLGTLSDTLFHRTWARHYLDLLDRDPDLDTDASIRHLRSIALDSDYATVVLTPEKTLRCLLEKNGKNRMAFEYLTTWYLTTRQLAKFTEHLGEFRNLGYAALPVHFEEAALVYVSSQRKPLFLGGYEPRADVRRRVEHFLAVMDHYKGNEQAARTELAKHHYGTYFFYFVYGQPRNAG